MTVTLANLRDHLDVKATTADAELLRFLAAAINNVEKIVGPLGVRNVTEYHQSPGSVIILRQSPVVSITQVRPFGWAGAGIALLAATYRLDADAGLLHLQNYASGEVEVTYVAGRTTVPEDIDTAVMIVAGRLWETQRGNSPSALPPAEFGGGAFSTGGLPLLPPLAVSLLEPYRRGPQVA